MENNMDILDMNFEVIKKLFGITKTYGYSEEDLSYLWETYGNIPKVLLKYYLELGKHNELNATYDFLIKPDKFNQYCKPDTLIFYSENQGCNVWGIEKKDVYLDNPPVYELYGKQWEKRFLACKSLSGFFLSMAHMQAMFSMKNALADKYGIENEPCKITKEQAEAIAINFLSKHADSDLYTGARFFGDYDDTIITVLKNKSDYLLMYGSNNRKHFMETSRKIDKTL